MISKNHFFFISNLSIYLGVYDTSIYRRYRLMCFNYAITVFLGFYLASISRTNGMIYDD